MNIEKKVRFSGGLAQIYKDGFYMFDFESEESPNNLWCYNLSTVYGRNFIYYP